MNDVESIFGELLDEKMSVETLTEANDKTLPAGTYRLDVVKKTPESASEASPWPGRLMIRLQADASQKNEEGEWVRKGRVFFDVSPKEARDKRNRLDGPTRLWANLVAVVGRGASNRDVLDFLGMYPLTATVSRTFKKLEGGYATPKTDEDERALLEAGAEPKNFVQTLRTFNESN
jgi:hypothetical protein